MNLNFLIGTYTKKYSNGLYKLILREDFSYSVEEAFTLNNPTFLDIQDHLLVTTTGDSKIGGICIFENINNHLKLLSNKNDFNVPPCHVSFYKNYILASNYHQGLFILYEYFHNSLKIKYKLHIPNSNLHFAKVYLDKIFLVDLKNSYIYVYSLATMDLLKKILIPQNKKPRHLEFKDNTAFLITEDSFEIISIDLITYNLIEILTPVTFYKGNFEGSAIHIFKNNIYIIDRKTNIISVFAIQNNTLKHIQNFSHISIQSSRDFIIINNMLLVCNYGNDSISIFSLDKNLKINKFLKSIPLLEPICIKKLKN